MHTPREALAILQRNIRLDIKNARATMHDIQVRIALLETEESSIDQLIGTLSQEDQDAIKDGK